MDLKEIKRLYAWHLERTDGTAMVGVKALQFLVNEVEKLEKERDMWKCEAQSWKLDD